LGRRRCIVEAQPDRTPKGSIASGSDTGSILELADIGVTVHFSDENDPAAMDAIARFLDEE